MPVVGGGGNARRGGREPTEQSVSAERECGLLEALGLGLESGAIVETADAEYERLVDALACVPPRRRRSLQLRVQRLLHAAERPRHRTRFLGARRDFLELFVLDARHVDGGVEVASRDRPAVVALLQ